MLTKLLKYELRDTAHTLIPIGMGVLALSMLTALANCLARSNPQIAKLSLYMIASAAIEMFTMLGFVVVLVACMAVTLSRFFRLLGSQGYLMLTLPATPFQHIASKLIGALLSLVATLVLLVLCGGIISAGMGETIVFHFSDNFLASLGTFAYVLLVFVLLAGGGFLFIYLCIAIAGHWPQQRLLASIVTYFALTFVLQFVGLILLTLTGYALATHLESFSLMLRSLDPNNMTGILYAVGAGFVLILAAFDAMLWAATQYLITKKLNLP